MDQLYKEEKLMLERIIKIWHQKILRMKTLEKQQLKIVRDQDQETEMMIKIINLMIKNMLAKETRVKVMLKVVKKNQVVVISQFL